MFGNTKTGWVKNISISFLTTNFYTFKPVENTLPTARETKCSEHWISMTQRFTSFTIWEMKCWCSFGREREWKWRWKTVCETTYHWNAFLKGKLDIVTKKEKGDELLILHYTKLASLIETHTKCDGGGCVWEDANGRNPCRDMIFYKHLLGI